MTKTAVFVATTDGPSAVQSITAEDPDVKSVFCLDRKAIPLEISDDYDAFVRRPTGVIESCFGHPAYRIDVSRRIGSGLSWQLGTFLAHALADAGMLADPAEGFARAIWASGEVDRGLRVGSVNEIGRKLLQSRETLSALLARKCEVFVIVPRANADEARAAVRDIGLDGADRIRFLGVNSTDECLAALRLPRQRRGGFLPARKTDRRSASRARRRGIAVGFGVVAASFAGVMAWAGNNGSLHEFLPTFETLIAADDVENGPPLPGILTQIVETRPPAGADCAAVHFGLQSPLVQKHAVPDAGQHTDMTVKHLCDFRYRLTNSGTKEQKLWVVATRNNADGGGFRARTVESGHLLAGNSSLDLDGRPPRHLKAPLKQALVVLAIPTGPRDRTDAIDTVIGRLVSATSRQAFAQGVDNVGKTGATVYRIEHVFQP